MGEKKAELWDGRPGCRPTIHGERTAAATIPNPSIAPTLVQRGGKCVCLSPCSPHASLRAPHRFTDAATRCLRLGCPPPIPGTVHASAVPRGCPRRAQRGATPPSDQVAMLDNRAAIRGLCLERLVQLAPQAEHPRESQLRVDVAGISHRSSSTRRRCHRAACSSQQWCLLSAMSEQASCPSPSTRAPPS